eukprot:10730-Heterococcus_DN1.PRE.1
MDSIHAMDPEVAIKHHTDVATYSTMTEQYDQWHAIKLYLAEEDSLLILKEIRRQGLIGEHT